MCRPIDGADGQLHFVPFLVPGAKKKEARWRWKFTYLRQVYRVLDWSWLWRHRVQKLRGHGVRGQKNGKRVNNHTKDGICFVPPQKKQNRRNTLCLDVTAFRETHAHKVPKWGNRRSIQKIRSFQLNLTKNSPTKRICFCQMHAVHSGT